MSKLVNKILKEVEFTETFELIVDNIPDLGRRLASGTNGTAWLYSGKVLKLTTYSAEAELCQVLLNKNYKYYTKIYSVQQVYINDKPLPYYIIIRDYLEEIENTEYNILGLISDLYYAFPDKVEYFISINADLKDYDSKLVNRIKSEYFSLIKELSELRITDLNPHNLGRKKDGTLAAFDCDSGINFKIKNFEPYYIDTLNE